MSVYAASLSGIISRLSPIAGMYDGSSCSDGGAARDLRRSPLVTSRLPAHGVKEELAAVEWPPGCGYRLPGWGSAPTLDTLKSPVKMSPPDLSRDRGYFNAGLYLGREALAAPGQRELDTQKRMPGQSARSRFRAQLMGGSKPEGLWKGLIAVIA